MHGQRVPERPRGGQRYPTPTYGPAGDSCYDLHDARYDLQRGAPSTAATSGTRSVMWTPRLS